MEDHKHELIVCIVNAGFSQNVMESARAAGAQGGTIIRARGSANPEAEEFYSINILRPGRRGQGHRFLPPREPNHHD